MRIRFLGAHNLETHSTRMAGLLVDDVLAIDCGGLTASLTLEEQHRVRAIALTHRHYDHIRDLPVLCLATMSNGYPLDLYASQDTLQALSDHLLSGTIYPDFRAHPTPDAPKLRLHTLEPLNEARVLGYAVLPVPVNHSVPALGFSLSSGTSGTLFYTGDTTVGLTPVWEHTRPDLLVTEVTFPSAMEEQARATRHLTPSMLGQELRALAERQGHLPHVVVVHMHPAHEETIRAELTALSSDLAATITPAHEGMTLEV